jgi:hypothetical protein
MIALFDNPKSGELESHLAPVSKYRTRPNAERVAAWIEKRIAERSAARTAFEAETCENKGGLLDPGSYSHQCINLSRLEIRAENLLNLEPFPETRVLSKSR